MQFLRSSYKIILLLLVGFAFASYSFAEQKPVIIKVKIANKKVPKKPFLELAKEMEAIAKTYQTSDQTLYWENEGRKSFDKLLKSQGYYSNSVNVDSLVGDKKNTIIFHLQPWRRYSIDSIHIKYQPDSNYNINTPQISELLVQPGHYAVAKNILKTEKQIADYIENNNCLLSADLSHQAVINHLEKKISLIFTVNAGQTATIEKVTFKGIKTVNPEYLNKLVKLENGQCFRNSDIAKSRGVLQKSGLFAATNPVIPKKTNEDGSVPVEFDLTERKPRSVKFGVGYSTDLGPGASAGWEHRNFFGSGEKATANIFGNKKEQTLDLGLVKPFFQRDDQTLTLGLSLENLISKAYNSREATLSGFVEREFTPVVTMGVGASFTQAAIKGRDEKKWTYASLLSTPVFLTHDTRSNILDPTDGHEIRTEFTPFFNSHEETKPFAKAQISASTYFLVPLPMSPVIAVRAATGSIFDVKLDAIPYTERFFVGGSGSLRGYVPQMASNLTSNNNPIGGRSFLETSIELRLRVAESVGIVGFLDSGYAYPDKIIPLKHQKILHGAGFGFRYVTDFGPLRLDIAFPLKRRKFIDHAWQAYFGIGQNF